MNGRERQTNCGRRRPRNCQLTGRNISNLRIRAQDVFLKVRPPVAVGVVTGTRKIASLSTSMTKILLRPPIRNAVRVTVVGKCSTSLEPDGEVHAAVTLQFELLGLGLISHRYGVEHQRV